MNIDKIRKVKHGYESGIYLNDAGPSLMPHSVIEVIAATKKMRNYFAAMRQLIKDQRSSINYMS
jgi:hypothetical protein